VPFWVERRLKVIVPFVAVLPEPVAVEPEGRVIFRETFALETGLLFWSKTVIFV